jgi:hypothetical protein
MPSQEPITPRQIKPESCREYETWSSLRREDVNLQPPRNAVHGYIKHHLKTPMHMGVLALNNLSGERALFTLSPVNRDHLAA